MVKITAYGLNNHPDISSFYDDYGAEDGDSFLDAFDEMSRNIAGYEVVPRLIDKSDKGGTAYEEYELDILCDTDDIIAQAKVIAAYAEELSH